MRESRANDVGSIPSCRRQIHVTVSVQTQIDGGAITPAAIIEPRGDDALHGAWANADFATPAYLAASRCALLVFVRQTFVKARRVGLLLWLLLV